MKLARPALALLAALSLGACVTAPEVQPTDDPVVDAQNALVAEQIKAQRELMLIEAFSRGFEQGSTPDPTPARCMSYALGSDVMTSCR